LADQAANAAVFCAPVTYTTRELKAVIFKRGGMPIHWQKQFYNFKEGQFLIWIRRNASLPCVIH